MTEPKIVLITGATSGIGSAVASAFCTVGARVFLTGRNGRKLATTVEKLPPGKLAGTALADLESPADVERLLSEIARQLPRIDLLIHTAGHYAWNDPGDTATEEFDRMFAVNVRAPYLLTQGLLPQLAKSRGQVIFINSSVVKAMGAGIAGYKASRHAMQGLTDSMRQDLNKRGIRVCSVFPGQVATARMRSIYAKVGKPYKPKLLMAPRDVAETVVLLSQAPRGVEITDVHLRSPTPY